MTQIQVQAQSMPDGKMRQVEEGGQKVLITRDGQTYAAYPAICPHAGAELGQGVRCGARVVCPWHHAAYDAMSGALLEPPAVKGLNRYPVSRAGDVLNIDLDAEMHGDPPAAVGDGDHTVIVGGGAAGFMAARTLRALHEANGVKFYLNAEVERLTGEVQVRQVQLKGGAVLDADVVLLGTGVRPRTELLPAERDDSQEGKGAVHVDEHLRLSA